MKNIRILVDLAEGQVWIQVRDQVGSQAWKQVKNRIYWRVRDLCESQVKRQIENQVRNSS